MAHLVRILSDARLKRGLLLTGQNLADIDENTKKAINGDEGGTWSPSSVIEIAGKGVVAAGPWSMSGAGVTVTTAANKRILFGKGDATDYFGHGVGHPGRTPAMTSRFLGGHSPPRQTSWGFAGVLTLVHGAQFHTPLSVYSGAPKIDSVDVTFIVQESHGLGVPQALPKMRVIAVASDGTVIPLRAKDATTDVEGFQAFPTPASGAAWYALAAVQTWTYTCNVALGVDSGAYTYFVEIIDESGTNAWIATGNLYIDATVQHSAVLAFDGRN